jgi:hypothetical protein
LDGGAVIAAATLVLGLDAQTLQNNHNQQEQ